MNEEKISESIKNPIHEENNSLLDALFDQSNVMIAHMNTQFNFLRVSKAYAEADEKDAIFFIGRNHFDLYPNEENDQIFRDVVETGEPYFVKTKDFKYAEHPDWGVTSWDWSLIPIKKPNGDVKSLVLTIFNVTAQKKIEEEFLKEKEFTETALNAQRDTFFVFDPSTSRAIRWNKAFSEITGYSNEDIAKLKAPESYYSEMDLEVAVKAIEKIYNEDRALLEMNLITKEGKTIPFEYLGTSINDEKGNLKYVVAIGRDITARKKAEQKLKDSEEKLRRLNKELEQKVEERTLELKKSEERWRALGENSPAHVMLLDEDQNIQFINRTVPDLTIDEVIGTSIYDYTPLEYKKVAADCYKHVWQTGEPCSYTTTYLTKDNATQYFEVWVGPVFQSDKIIALIGHSLNVTERKKKEEEIRLQSKIIENMSEGVYLIKLDDGTIFFTNPAFEEMFGYNPGEMIGNNVAIVNAPTDKTPEETREEIMGILEATGEWHGEVLNVRKDGTPFWCYANVSLFDHPEYGTVIVSVHTDITERKNSELALKKREYELEERVKELICLYNLSRLVEVNDITPEQIMSDTLDLIPPAWQYPEITCARITYDGRMNSTKNYAKTEWVQKAEIKVRNEVIGTIEVNYLKEKPSIGEGPFLKEERNLLNALVEILGRFFERKKADQSLKESEERYRNLNSVLEQKVEVRTKELRESEEQFRTIAEQSLMGIEIIQNGKIVYINEAAAKILEYSVQEMGKWEMSDMFKSIHPDDLPIAYERQKKRQEEGISLDPITYRCITKSGKIKWQEVYAKNIVYKGKEAIFVIVHDISNRKIAEQELKESEEKYRLIFDNSPIGIGISNKAGEIITINKKMEELTNFTLEEINKFGLQATYVDLKERSKLLKILDETGMVKDYELKLKRGDGTHYLGLLNINMIDIRGEMLIHTAMMDITERRNAEIKLKESQEKIRNLIENISYVLTEANSDGVITFLSPQIFEITGSQPEEIIGTKIANYIHPEDLIIHQKALKKALDFSSPFSYECRIRHKKGYYVPISVKGSPVIVNNELRLYGVIRDITERRKVDDMIKREIKQLKELDQIRNDLIRRISHELNTPLISILSGSQHLLDSYNDQMINEALNVVKIIHQGGHRLKELVDNLITAYELETDQIILKMKPENLVAILMADIEKLTFQAERRKVFINIVLPNQLNIDVDEKMISKSIANLISNAIKNTPPNGNIFIKSIEHHNYVDIIIKDTGVGLTDEEMPIIFKKFGKIERHGKGMDVDIEGPGLGLYLANELVKLHKGEIFVKSKGRNKGSTFTIRLFLN